MGLPEDLLAQAEHLLRMDDDQPKQASLRRAVSTAYYALFHLLIDEAVGYWGVERHRPILARTFDHGRMRNLCAEHVNRFYKTKQPSGGVPLKEVAEAFFDLQQQRHIADYDNSHFWMKVAAEAWIAKAKTALAQWKAIRTEPESQDFLLSLLLPKPPRS
jgi:uncharacterized protein (UPF0332 family)